MPAEFHLAEHAFALELLFQGFQRLIDVVVTDENLHLAENSQKLKKGDGRRSRDGWVRKEFRGL